MRAIRYILKAIVGWLDRKFPDRLTTTEVDAKFKELEARVAVVETCVPQMRVEIAKCKMLVGVEQLTRLSE